jgi:hypothetical protein
LETYICQFSNVLIGTIITINPTNHVHSPHWILYQACTLQLDYISINIGYITACTLQRSANHPPLLVGIF